MTTTNEPRCSAHGDKSCRSCSRSADGTKPGGTCYGCVMYAETGMHWDTCANRVRGPLAPPAQPAEPSVQLVVEYADMQTRYYPADRGWRIDAAHRCIVIGRDLPRTHVPLDHVVAFHVEHVNTRYRQ